MRSIIFAAALALVAPPAHAQFTTVQPFGNGYIANTPFHPPTTIQPFAGGAIMNTPFQQPTTINRFGNGYIINRPQPLPSQMPCYMPMGCNQ